MKNKALDNDLEPVLYIDPYIYVNWYKLQKQSYPSIPEGWSKRKSFFHCYPLSQDSITTIKSEAKYYLHLHKAKDILDISHISYLLALMRIHEQKELIETKKPSPVTEPYPHQVEMLDLALSRKASALFCDMRTGKTKVIIDAFREKKKAGLVDKCLVIVPVSAIWTWRREIKKHSKKGEFQFSIVRGTPNKRKMKWSEFPGKDFYITNYELLSIDISYIRPFVDDFTFLVLDEAHKIKTHNRKRSKTAVELGDQTDHKSALTGTPIANNAFDIWNIYRFLDRGDQFGISYWRFIDKYFFRQGYRTRPCYDTPQKFHHIMYEQEGHLAIRFTQKEVDKYFPEMVYEVIKLQMTEKQKKTYKQVEQAIVTEIEEETKQGRIKTSAQILAKLLRLSMVSCGFVTAKEAVNLDEHWDGDKYVIPIPGPNPKMEALEEIIESMGILEWTLQNGNIDYSQKPPKLVVWSRFVYNTKGICKFLESKGVNYKVLFGETSEKDRVDIDEKFNSDTSCLVFVGNPQSGGISLDLSSANTQVFFSNDYSLLNREQAEARLRTSKQEMRSINIIDLCVGDIDRRITRALKDKKDLSSIINRDNIREFLYDKEEKEE